MNYLKSPTNIIIALLVAYLIYQRVPMWLDQYNKEGQTHASKTYIAIDNKGNNFDIQFPDKGKNTLAIFWATWCGPCKVEMARLKSSVLAGKIPPHSIIAINSHEDIKLQQKHIYENNYPFLFIQAPLLEKELEVAVTPTTAFFEGQQLKDLSSGISLIGIKQAELFLSKNPK